MSPASEVAPGAMLMVGFQQTRGCPAWPGSPASAWRVCVRVGGGHSSQAELQARREPLPSPPGSASAERTGSQTGQERSADHPASRESPSTLSIESGCCCLSGNAGTFGGPLPCPPPPVWETCSSPETHRDGDGIRAGRGEEQGDGAAPLKKYPEVGCLPYSGSCLVAQTLPGNKLGSQQGIRSLLVLP